MNHLWRHSDFSNDDYSKFRCLGAGPFDAGHSRGVHVDGNSLGSNNSVRECNVKNLSEMQNWFRNDVFRLSGPEASAAMLFCTRTKHEIPSFPDDHSSSLKYIPFEDGVFREVVSKLRLHRAIAVVLKSGAPSWTRIPCKIEGQTARVYILRSQGSFSGRMALSITYFPEALAQPPFLPRGSKMFAVFLGCSPAEATKIAKELRESPAAAVSPFTLIKIFLEMERRNRLDQVDQAVNELEAVIQNFNVSVQDTWELSTADKSDQDPKQMIKRYLRVSHLKNGLVAWKTQMERMAEWAAEFRKMPSTRADIDPRVYIRRIIDDYDIRINDCETAMQGSSLTFEMETAHQARQDTDIAIRDGKAMKTMALVTTFFLPGTFFAVSVLPFGIDTYLLTTP
ncbi:hypothetical protein GQ53DRAFT_524817 [Thozetella sp. PMI_491]|nr:hypothetical protein GQ53DRAFT_524817 [Thozetella sp. PMI_491]